VPHASSVASPSSPAARRLDYTDADNSLSGTMGRQEVFFFFFFLFFFLLVLYNANTDHTNTATMYTA
jgi:hypothetical protein